MNAKDQLKVLQAGFTIIRADDFPTFRIKQKTKQEPEWRTLEKDFSSRTARDCRMSELLLKQNCVQD